jgi:putative nucleotidyltransferase with HDIG domain
LSEVDLHDAPEVASVQLDALLSRFQDLPTIPEVLARIWQLVDDPRSSASDLERVVSHEPPLAAKVLRLANSPYYGGRGRVQDVRSAITTLGFDTLRNLAVCLSVAGGLAARENQGSLLDRRALWRHSVACAVGARRIARELGVEGAEETFTAGLLHDIGIFVIALGRPQAYSEIVHVGLERSCDQCEAERAVLGFDHAEVGCAFAQHWHFPLGLQDLIANHHCPVTGERAAQKHVLRLADALAHRVLDAPVLPDFEARPVADTDLLALGLAADELETLVGAIATDVRSAHEFMNLV